MNRKTLIRLIMTASILISGGQGIADQSRRVVLNGLAKLPNGNPLANSELTVFVKGHRNRQETSNQVTTNKDGEFRVGVERLAASYWVRIKADGHRTSLASKVAASDTADCRLRRNAEGIVPVDSKLLQCKLNFPKAEYRVGERITPAIHIENRSEETVLMVGSLDGSYTKRRYPYCYFEVNGPDEDAFGVAVCGLVNELRSEDFVEVDSRSSFAPTDSGKDGYGFLFPLKSFRLRKPGEYKISFVYDSSSQDLSDWLSPSVLKRSSKVDRAELGQFLQAIPHVVLKSDIVSLKIVK